MTPSFFQSPSGLKPPSLKERETDGLDQLNKAVIQRMGVLYVQDSAD
jgi:hypothetical protein